MQTNRPAEPTFPISPFGKPAFSIMAGRSVHTDAAADFNGNQIEGFMMESTWAVMARGITSILVTITNNTAIPVAFAFVPTELRGLDLAFDEMFR
jgi:hypothetical protein